MPIVLCTCLAFRARESALQASHTSGHQIEGSWPGTWNGSFERWAPVVVGTAPGFAFFAIGAGALVPAALSIIVSALGVVVSASFTIVDIASSLVVGPLICPLSYVCASSSYVCVRCVIDHHLMPRRQRGCTRDRKKVSMTKHAGVAELGTERPKSMNLEKSTGWVGHLCLI